MYKKAQKKFIEYTFLLAVILFFAVSFLLIWNVYADDYSWVDLNWKNFTWNNITITWSDWWIITIMDRNLWATTNITSNTWSYWYHYQWWNNYWFEPCYVNWCEDFPWWEQILYVWDYGALFNSSYNNKWYFSNIYIRSDKNYKYDYWSDSNINLHNGLWWGSWDIQSNHYWLDFYNFSDRQWPCPDWWHVPNIGEWSKLVDYRAEQYKVNNPGFELQSSWGLSLFENNSDASLSLRNYFKLPLAWVTTTYKVVNLWEIWFYLSSSPNIENWPEKYYVLWLWVNNTVGWAASYVYRWYWSSVRCFKNIYPKKDSEIIVNIAALNNGQNTCSWEDYIFPNISALPTVQTISLAKRFSCIFWNAAAKAVTLQLSGDLKDWNGNVISWENVKLSNPDWTAAPAVLKNGTTTFSEQTFLWNWQTLFNKVANKIWEAYWSGVEIKITIPAWTPDWLYEGTLVLTY